MCFARDGRCFITQPQIEGQIGPRSPVIHNVSRENRLAEGAWHDSTSDWRVKRRWLVLQERRSRGLIPQSAVEMCCPARGSKYHETVIAPSRSNVSSQRQPQTIYCAVVSRAKGRVSGQAIRLAGLWRVEHIACRASLPASNPAASAKPSTVADRSIDRPGTPPTAKPRTEDPSSNGNCMYVSQFEGRQERTH